VKDHEAPIVAGIESFEQLVRDRRTTMVVDPTRDVSTEVLQRLADLAVWAPNYKRTHPWRFAAFVGAGRVRLGEAFVSALLAAGETDQPRLAKTRMKYTRTPAILVVGCESSARPDLHTDDLYATAAGIQNLLLGATALGLASYWSTPPVDAADEVGRLCGFAPGTVIVGVIYLGWPGTEQGGTGRRERAVLAIID